MRNIVRGAVDGVNVLTVNPVNISAKKTKRTPFDVYMVVYERIRTRPQRAPVVRGEEQDEEEDWIAHRIKNNPRVRGPVTV